MVAGKTKYIDELAAAMTKGFNFNGKKRKKKPPTVSEIGSAFGLPPSRFEVMNGV